MRVLSRTNLSLAKQPGLVDWRVDTWPSRKRMRLQRGQPKPHTPITRGRDAL